MDRILVIGSAGSGKSTLSREIGHATGLPVVHLDRHYWKPHWTPMPNVEWDVFVEQVSLQEQWIMDGNYSRTLELRAKRADTIIFLDMPRYLCMYRILKRRWQYRGRTRPDLNEDCPEKLDWPFLVWVWNFRKRSRPNILRILDNVKDSRTVIILSSRKQVKEFRRGRDGLEC
ncbi:DNA topology modulation protein [Cohnella candidum]|uniref:DNA topology modulation protein n=1 Tax=Cohnella candidum TaxID=2674991 RepID=A0A3G3JW60_9BACL|nr:DNA topology modulation protein [Cohnella candidum]AYQ72468.1 DNA topology modulation protein [Cohnella candidum]